MALLSSPMDWEPTHRGDYTPAWQPPMSGRRVVVAHERDHPSWVPPMPGAFVDTPPRRNEVGLRCGGGFHSPSRKRTVEGAQFEDHPQYVGESADIIDGLVTMKLRYIITAVCWFAGITWASAQWTFRKARRVQVTEIRRVAADGYTSIKRRATEVMRPSAPTAEQIAHQRRAQTAPRQSLRQLPRNLRPASAQLRSRKSSREHTVPQNTTGAQPMGPPSPPASPLAADIPILETQERTIDRSALVEDVSDEDSFEERRKESRLYLEKVRLKRKAIEDEEKNRPKSLDEMIALENARKLRTHDETTARKQAQKQVEEDKLQKMAQELARKKSQRIAQQEAAKEAERLVQEMARPTSRQRPRPAERVTRPRVQLVSPQSSRQDAEDEADSSEQDAGYEAETPAKRLARTIGKQQANRIEKVPQLTVRSILKRNHQQEAQDEPSPSIQAPVVASADVERARDESYGDFFLMPEVYEDAEVLEAGVEVGLKSLALESSNEHAEWKTEDDKRRKKVFEEYTRLAAEELARAQAEAEKLAREIAEEEAGREPHTGRRRLQTKLVQLSDEWQVKVDQAMRKGEGATLATTLDGTQLVKRDFVTVLGRAAWLNDNIINSYVDMVVEHANKKAGRNQRDKTPKVVAQSSFFYKKIRDDGPQSVSRWMRRKRAGGEKLLEVETMLIPVNNAAHWTLIVVCPKARTIEYLDSFGGPKDVFISNTKAWLAIELGSAWNEDDWRVLNTKSASQHNGYDCGVFAITNAECVVGGVTTTSYDGGDMTMQRRRIAAVLLNGGFGGDLEAAEDM
ncbi:hypothetical protein V501_04207 [Pseudogymnoascus sp. VKM F-4519 (FW-2642)]|nr:hypothetical protein V501_04207 [Pseudogymnoascus sp. VKM F-4519 (FW-2642)]